MKWISVKDQLPSEGEFLGYDSINRTWVVEFICLKKSDGYAKDKCYFYPKNDNDKCCACINPDFDKTPITHWQLLPEKPE